MTLQPSPLTAALAGVFSAVLLPWAWRRWGGGDSVSVELVLMFLAGVALPAHAFVVGFGRVAPQGRAIDTALLIRVGAWLLAAGLTLAVTAGLRG